MACCLFSVLLLQFSSVAQSCPTLCDPMACITPGLPVHHQLPEFTQTHVHWVGDAIQPSHPLSSPSPSFNLSQHQGVFKWVSSSHQVAKVLECQLHSCCLPHDLNNKNENNFQEFAKNFEFVHFVLSLFLDGDSSKKLVIQLTSFQNFQKNSGIFFPPLSSALQPPETNQWKLQDAI